MEKNKEIRDIRSFSKVFESHIRLKMLAALRNTELTYNQLKKLLDCSDGIMTTHTRKLLAEGYIIAKKEFKNNKQLTTYYISDQGKADLDEYLEAFIQMAKETIVSKED